MHAMTGPLPFALGIVVIALTGVVGVRWAKKHSKGAEVVASALLLVFCLTIPIVNPPQQGITQTREDKSKKGAESGDPPDDELTAGGQKAADRTAHRPGQ